MHISLDSALGRQRRLNSVGESVFQIAPDAAAGYSLRSLTGGDPSVVRVRRESDNGERDFRSSEINSGEMVNWVNQQVIPPLDLRTLTATGRDGPIIEAAAAYSLRNLSDSYTGSVVEVRRTSDNAVRSFTAAEVTDGTLTTWVNADVDKLDLQTESGALIGNVTNETATGFDFSVNNEGSGGFKNLIALGSGVEGTYLVTFDVVLNSGSFNGVEVRVSSPFLSTELSSGANSISYNAASGSNVFFFTNSTASADVSITNLTLTQTTADGTVSKWYDQSTTSGTPNAKHAVQTDAAKQPKIVSGGSLITGGLDFDGVDERLITGSFSLTQAFTSFSVTSTDVSSTSAGIWGIADSESSPFEATSFYRSDDGFAINSGATLTTASTQTYNTGRDYLKTSFFDGASSSIRVDGVTKVTATAGTTNPSGLLMLGQFISSSGGTGIRLNGKIQEIIIYDSDQTDNRTAFEANIGEVYGIAGIPAYDNTVNGFVETWYDQSGNGNNATQLTAGSQPKIVDAGALVTGGLDFDGVNDNLDCPNTLSQNGQADATIFVGKLVDNLATYGFCDNSGASPHFIRGITTNFGTYLGVNVDLNYATANTDENLHFVQKATTSNQSFGSLNGVTNSLDAGTFGYTSGVIIGSSRLPSAFLKGSIKEFIIYASDQTANRLAIEANINNQYDIY